MPDARSSEQVAALVDELGNQKTLGYTAENGFKPAAWTAVAQAVNKAGATEMTVKKCKSKWQRLKQDHGIIEKLRALSGAGWNAEEGIITLPPEVWDAYTEAHPKAAKFRKKPFPLYDDITAIIAKVTATGEAAVSSRQILARMRKSSNDDSSEEDEEDEVAVGDGDKGRDQGEEEDPHSGPDSPHREPVHVDGNRSSPETSPPSTPLSNTVRRACTSQSDKHHPPPPPPPTSSSSGQKRKRNDRVSGGTGLLAVADSLKAVANAVSQEPSTTDPGLLSTPARKTKAFQMICEDEGLSDEELAYARKLFRGSDRSELADEYLSFSSEKRSARSTWLRQELNKLMYG